MKSLIIYTCITFFWTAITFSQAGSLDPEFGESGLVVTSFFDGEPTQGYAIATDENGIIVSGILRDPAQLHHAFLARYSPDGTPDNSFNGSGKIIIQTNEQSSSSAVITQPNGKVILVTNQSNGQEVKVVIYRYNTDGSPDNEFDDDGVVTSSLGAMYLSLSAISLQPDGKILVGGYVGFDQDTFDQFLVIRYLPDGSLDESFDEDGIAISRIGQTWTNISTLLVQPDKKIIAVGYAVFNNNDEFALVRYNEDGTLDEGFSDDGIAHTTLSTGEDRARGAGLLPNGKIVVGGYAYSSLTGKSDYAAARFNGDGTLDNTFHGDGMTTVMVSDRSNGVRSMILQPDGKILLGGYVHKDLVGGADMALVRLNENGIPDITFDGDGIAIYLDDDITTSEIHELALQPDGKIVGTGYVRTEGLNSVRVARFISGLTVSTDEIHVPAMDISLYPNPASEEIVIDYELKTIETISVQLCDVQGRTVQELMPAGERFPGKYSEKLSIDRLLPPGSYFVKMESKNWIKSFKILLD